MAVKLMKQLMQPNIRTDPVALQYLAVVWLLFVVTNELFSRRKTLSTTLTVFQVSEKSQGKDEQAVVLSHIMCNLT